LKDYTGILTERCGGIERWLAQLQRDGDFFQVTIKLAAWASLSTKPLSLRGAWAGLKYLEKLYSLLLPNMAQRDQIPISKPSGKCLICV